MSVDVLLGLQWGDEGKGKIVDVLTNNYDIIARFQGGPNAGHTLEFDGIKHVLHTIPSGIFHKNVTNIVGNGVVIDPIIFKKEIDALKSMNIDLTSSLLISKKAHLIIPTHKILDGASEKAKGNNKIGSTLKGIGPTYMDKTGRNGLRVGDISLLDFKDRYNKLFEKHSRLLENDFHGFDIQQLEIEFFEGIELLKEFTHIDSEHFLHQAIKSGKKILAEGAQGTLLDIDFGSYPFVTSSNTISAGACTGLGIAPNKIKDVYGIFKAYCTRVGSGPFPTELFNDVGESIGKVGNEFGATTGRKRRCGWLDLPALKYAIAINGVTKLMMMKADVLSHLDSIKVCTHYIYKGQEIDFLPFDSSSESITPIYKEIPSWGEDLTNLKDINQAPSKLIDYIEFLEKELQTPIVVVSVGPDRIQTLKR